MPAELIKGSDLLEQVRANTRELLPSGYPYLVEADALTSSVDPKTMSASFVVVTRRKKPNRNGHTVQIAENEEAQGLRLDNYAKNPVVLFDHGQNPFLTIPMGKAENPAGELQFRKLQTKAESTVFFSQTLPEAGQIFALVDEGILRTSSISFLPLLGRRNKFDQKKRSDDIVDFDTPFWSFDFLEGDLLEWSIVGIPADADAVRKYLDRGQINGEKITQSMLPTLQAMGGGKPIWAPGWHKEEQSLETSGEQTSDGAILDRLARLEKLMEDRFDELEDLIDVPEREEQESAPAPAPEPEPEPEVPAPATDRKADTFKFDAAEFMQGFQSSVEEMFKPVCDRLETVGQQLRAAQGRE